jgi:hypothetical protein
MNARLAFAVVGLLCWEVRSDAALTRATADHVRSLVISRTGVDAAGRLWAWNAVSSEVTLISPSGARRTVDVDLETKAVDVDGDRGVAILGTDGTSVTIAGLDGKITSQFKLPAVANNIAWLSGNQVGVTPERTGALVEVWNTGTKVRTGTFGEAAEVKVPSRGAVLSRAMLLRFDGARQELAVLDAFYGNVTVFDAAGRTLRSAQVTHPRLGANLVWLKNVDEDARAHGESSTPTMYNYARMSMSGDGTIWLGEDGPTADSITLVRISPQGKVKRQSVAVPECASVRYEVWQDQLVFYREPKSPRKQCTLLKEVPR